MRRRSGPGELGGGLSHILPVPSRPTPTLWLPQPRRDATPRSSNTLIPPGSASPPPPRAGDPSMDWSPLFSPPTRADRLPPGPVTARGQTRRTVRSHVSAAAHVGHTVPPHPQRPRTSRQPPPRSTCQLTVHPPLPRPPPSTASAVNTPPQPPHAPPPRTPIPACASSMVPVPGGVTRAVGCHPPSSTTQAAFDGHWGGAAPPHQPLGVPPPFPPISTSRAQPRGSHPPR